MPELTNKQLCQVLILELSGRNLGAFLNHGAVIVGRPSRLEFSGALYHVTSTGNRQEAIYESAILRSFLEKFKGLLRTLDQPAGYRIRRLPQEPGGQSAINRLSGLSNRRSVSTSRSATVIKNNRN